MKDAMKKQGKETHPPITTRVRGFHPDYVKYEPNGMVNMLSNRLAGIRSDTTLLSVFRWKYDLM